MHHQAGNVDDAPRLKLDKQIKFLWVVKSSLGGTSTVTQLRKQHKTDTRDPKLEKNGKGMSWLKREELVSFAKKELLG